MIFANTRAINEDASNNTGNAGNEPDEVVIHSPPVAKTQDEMPLLSTIKDYEDGQKGDQSECM